jgi:hypothetical protein
MRRTMKVRPTRERVKNVRATLMFAAVFLTACSSGQVGVQPATTVSNPAAARLQFAVGVATFAINGGSFIGFNSVETFRQGNGLSGVLISTPKITGPPTFQGEIVPPGGGTANYISGTPPGGDCAATTFGCIGGAFGYGIAPDNLIGSTQSFAQYVQPMLFKSNGVSQETYYGGPPAWPIVTNGQYPQGFVGYSPGFLSFDTPPVPGAYTLAVQIPTGITGHVTVSATAQLSSLTPLPVLSPPQPFADPNNPGGLLMDVNVPAGVTEAWYEVADRGVCYPQTTLGTNQAFYTVRTTQTGAQQLMLPSDLGPSTGPGTTHTICTAADNQAATGNPNATGDLYTLYAVGFDYPAFSAAYPKSNSAKPAIAGANGQADITVSTAAQYVYGTEPSPMP